METVIVAALCLALLAYRERANAREREQLFQRIQAPEIATLPEFENATFVSPEDDEGYWEAVEER